MTIQDAAGAAASPARPSSLTEQIYERTHEKILSASLRQETSCSRPISLKRYGVSKTPVREAFRQLADRGWILTIPRRGYLVKPLRLHDIKEVFELRLLLEPGLFAHAARGGDAAHFARLRELVDRTAEEAMPDDSPVVARPRVPSRRCAYGRQPARDRDPARPSSTRCDGSTM